MPRAARPRVRTQTPGHVVLMAQFAIASSYLDDSGHRVRVCFVSAVSRVVARGEGDSLVKTANEPSPQAIVEADFVARFR